VLDLEDIENIIIGWQLDKGGERIIASVTEYYIGFYIYRLFILDLSFRWSLDFFATAFQFIDVKSLKPHGLRRQ